MNTSNGKMLKDSYTSYVTLRQVSDKVLKKYLDSGQYKQKAGAYNIADPEFESFIEKIEGCKYNTMGMPIEKVKKMISEVSQ